MVDEGGLIFEDVFLDDLWELEEIDLGFELFFIMEEIVQVIRNVFGDLLFEGFLNEEQYCVYERLYGKFLFVLLFGEEVVEGEEGVDEGLVGMMLLWEGWEGELEEIEFDDVEEEVEGFEEEIELQDEFCKKVKFNFDDVKFVQDMEIVFFWE